MKRIYECISMLAVVLILLALSSGCTTIETQVEVVEQPDKEAMWADWVKDYYPSWKQNYWVDRDLWGNRGYLQGSPPPIPEEKTSLIKQEPIVIIEEKTTMREEPPAMVVIEQKTISMTNETPMAPAEYIPEAPAPSYYTVKKGDSLWYIAGDKEVYSDPLKWPLIYKANKEKIKNPDLIYPGQKLIIPRD